MSDFSGGTLVGAVGVFFELDPMELLGWVLGWVVGVHGPLAAVMHSASPAIVAGMTYVMYDYTWVALLFGSQLV